MDKNRKNLKNTSKKTINFITYDLGINGGTKAIIEFAYNFVDLGYNVNIIYPAHIFPKIFNYEFDKEYFLKIGSKILRIFKQLIGKNPNDDSKIKKWFKIRANVLKVPHLSNKYIPDADFVFATWWETASHVKKLNASKGKKCYLIQHYEVWGGRKNRVDETYKYGFFNVVNSNWLKEIILKETGVKTNATILHSPDDETFNYKLTKRKDKDIRVMIVYRNIVWKGMKEGIAAFEKAKKQVPNLKLVLAGQLDNQIPKYAEAHKGPVSQEKLNELYNSADIFLFPSLIEGFGMPPMEAMRCKVAVVSTDVGALRDYSIDGVSVMLSKPGDINAMANNIVKLAKNEKLRKQIAENGYKNIQKYTWRETTKQLNEYLEKLK